MNNNNQILDKNSLIKETSTIEENRLKIENIEHLEKESNNLKKTAINYAIAAGLNGINTLLFLFIATKTQSLYVIPMGMFAACSLLNATLSFEKQQKKKELDQKIKSYTKKQYN